MSLDWTSVVLEGACIGGISVAWWKRRHSDLSRKSFWGFVLPLAAYVPISIGILVVGTKSNILAGVTMAGFLAVLIGAVLSLQGLFERPASGNRRLNFGFGLASWAAIASLWVTPWAQGIGMASADPVPPRSSTSAKATLATSYRSKQFHYSIDLTGAGWKRVDQAGSNFEAADLLVIHGSSFLAIGAVDLHGIDLSLDMLARGVAMEPDRKQKMPETQDVERSENEITFIQDAVNANDFKQRCRVVKGNGIAWVLVGQWHTSHNELALEVKNAMARFKPETHLSGAPFRPEDLTPLQRRGQAGTLNRLAINYFLNQQLAVAAQLFDRAIDYAPSEERIANNAAQCFKVMQKYQDGLHYIERCDAAVRRDPYIQLFQTFFLTATGKKDEAIDVFNSIFNGGFVSDEAFASYVKLLMERGRNSDAIARLDKYLSQRESAPLRVLQAGLLQRENRVSEALDLLASLRKGSFFNPLVEIAFAEALIAAKKPKEALATLDALAHENYNPLAVQILRSRAQALARENQRLQL